jgi:NTE family protein
MRSPFAPLVPLALACAAAAATEPLASQAAARPRVCLVLSGGGALGLAHVGVLEVLEELRVPVDCVAGTSMGAIVGGLYAAGYSPAELRDLALTTDWRALIEDTPDRRRLPYRRKVDDLTYLTRWEFGLSGGKLRMPSGLVAGHRLGSLLQVLGLRAADVEDFDRLPLPFRAVAADIGTGETVVLRSGNLARALRASMAVPGLFSPVEVNGRLLVDGGMVANLPVDAARAMGAEVIIAVDLGEPLTAQERPDSIASILSRTSTFLTRLNVEQVLPSVNVLIRPHVAEFGLLSFSAAAEILPRGQAAARQQETALAALAVDDAAWQSFLARHRRATPRFDVTTLAVDPGPGLAPGAVARSVRTRPGRPLDVEVLERDLDTLWELGEYESVGFTLAPDGDGYALSLTGRQKSWGPNYLRFGVSLATDLEGSSQFSLLGAMTMTRLNRLGAELKVAAQAGENPLASAEFYQPLGASQVPFAAATVQASLTKHQIPIGEQSVQYRLWQQRLALDLGLALGRYGELRLGVRRDSSDGRPTSSESPDLPTFDQVDAGLRLSAVIDQIDNVNFPRRGLLLIGEVYEATDALGADQDYRRADVQLVGAASARQHSLVTLARGWSGLGGPLPPTQRPSLGGLFHLSGLPPGEVSGDVGGVLSLLYLYRLGRLPALGGGIFAGGSVEAGNAWLDGEEVSLSDLRHSFAVVFGLDTGLGPVYLAHGTTSGGKDSFYLYLGRTF